LFLDVVGVLPGLLQSSIHRSPEVGEIVAELGDVLPRIAVVQIARVNIALKASNMREQQRDLVLPS
jgi:hypothetical protein